MECFTIVLQQPYLHLKKFLNLKKSFMRVSTGNTVVRPFDYFRVFGTVKPELDNGLMIFGGFQINR